MKGFQLGEGEGKQALVGFESRVGAGLLHLIDPWGV